MALTPLDRRIAALAVPALGALVVEPLYGLTDTAIVGHLGRAPLGGLALATAALSLLGWLSGFLTMATTSTVGARHGAGDEPGAAAAATSAYAVAAGLGVVLAAIALATAPLAARLLGGHGTLGHDAVVYLRVAAAGLPFLLLTLAGNGHLAGLADTRTPFVVLLGSNVLNVVLEIALVYGAHLGIAGSALGTVVAQVAAAVAFVAIGRRRMGPLREPPRRDDVTALLRDGVRLFLRTASLGTALLASTAIAARLGVAQLGGHQIALQVWLLLALVLDALAIPAQILISRASGAAGPMELRRIGDRTLRVGLVVGVGVGVVTAALAVPLPLLFSPDGAVRHQATLALFACAVLQPFAALAFVYDGLLLGTADYAVLQRAMALALLAFAPLAVVTAVEHRLGILGVWAALACWLAARAALLARQWSRRHGRLADAAHAAATATATAEV